MNRSHLLTGGAATVASINVVRASARGAQFSYKLGHPQPVDAPIHVRSVQMANAIKAETNGRLEIQIYPNSLLGSQPAMIGQLRLGSIQFTTVGDASYTSIVPVFAIDTIGFAFSSSNQPIDALLGPLGSYIRREFAAKGLYAFDRVWAVGFSEVTSSTKPIRTADDFVGFKVRIALSPVILEMFKALGASPVPIDASELYSSLQTHLVDGEETALQIIATYRLYEVQKYLSFTNHRWASSTLVANGAAWDALPADIQTVVKRNADKYANLCNNDTFHSSDAYTDKLRRQGLTVNTSDSASMRARLGAYYVRWKKELGSTAWELLEAKVGKLG